MKKRVAKSRTQGQFVATMKGCQVVAARGLLGLSQSQLAAAAGVSVPTMRDIESEKGDPRRSNLDKVREYLESRGIRFSSDEGVVGYPPSVSRSSS